MKNEGWVCKKSFEVPLLVADDRCMRAGNEDE